MSDTTTEHLTHTVMFEAKVSDGNFGSNGAAFYVQFPTDLAATTEEILTIGEDRMLAAKALVERSLPDAVPAAAPTPAPVELTGEAAVRAEFGGAQTVPPGDTSSPPYAADTKDTAERNANAKWVEERIKALGDNWTSEFWDNRPKINSGEYSEKSPIYKHKDSGVGYWPPKN